MFHERYDKQKAPDISPDAFTRAFNHPHNEQLKYLTKVADLNAQSQALDAYGLQTKAFDSYTQFLSCKKASHIDSLSLSGLLASLSSSSFIEEGSPCHVKEVCDSDFLNVLQDDYYDFSDSLSTQLSVDSSDSSSLNSSVSAQAVLNNKPGCFEILYGNSQNTLHAIEDKVQSPAALRLSYNLGGMFRHAPFYNNFVEKKSVENSSIESRPINNSFDDSLLASSSAFLYGNNSFDSRNGSLDSPACPIGNTSYCDMSLSDALQYGKSRSDQSQCDQSQSDRTSTRFLTFLGEDSFLTLFETREGCQPALFFQKSEFNNFPALHPDLYKNNQDDGFAAQQITDGAFDVLDQGLCSKIPHSFSLKAQSLMVRHAVGDRAKSPALPRLSYNHGSMFRHTPFYKQSSSSPNPTIH